MTVKRKLPWCDAIKLGCPASTPLLEKESGRFLQSQGLSYALIQNIITEMPH
jgi:hypothetical protein